MAKWYAKAAGEHDLDVDYDTAREQIYGMPYSEWKDQHQLKATPEQMAEYKEKFPD